MQARLHDRRDELIALTKTDPDPTVRHHAQVLVIALTAPSQEAAARTCAVGVRSLQRWQTRFLADGRAGLVNRPRSGRPRALPEAARQVLERALGDVPRTYGYPTTVWTIADLTDLLAGHGWTAARSTVRRTVRDLGYVYRRPRHDLRHRQDAEAVASAAEALRLLQKRGLITPAEYASSISMSANSTPIPTWCRSGSSGAPRSASPPRAPTSD